LTTALRGAVRRGDDPHHPDRQKRDNRRSERLGDEHALSVSPFEERLHRSLLVGEAVEQTRASIKQKVGRHLGGGVVDGLLRGGSPVDPSKQKGTELREDRDLRQKRLSLRGRQEADEIIDIACRQPQRTGEPAVFLLGSPRHLAGFRVACPYHRTADRDSIDCRRAGFRSAFGVHWLGWALRAEARAGASRCVGARSPAFVTDARTGCRRMMRYAQRNTRAGPLAALR
jgi:hypothetical protein